MRASSAVALLAAAAAAAASGGAAAQPLHLTVVPPPPLTPLPPQGNGTAPNGETVGFTSRYFTLNGAPWTPVGGEMHYSRVPPAEWRDGLLKLKGAGYTVINAYVIWLHHEEVQGVWNWTGARDLRAFATLVGELGLRLHLRIGPWCHAEARSGGFPDWLVAVPGIALRTNTTAFMGFVGALYAQVFAQVHGLLHADGGPVWAVQVDNEYSGPGSYLLALRALAAGAGFDVPLWTRTGWPAMSDPPPFGSLLPYEGGYFDGFWDRTLGPVASYSAQFLLGSAPGAVPPPNPGYPDGRIEVGGGMPASYHRRIRMHPADMGAGATAVWGRGAASLGYYMAHGGQNPPGALTTLQESNSLGWQPYNDLPIKSYDFYAPVGEYGQLRPHYHAHRRLHAMLGDADGGWGAAGAAMTSTAPDVVPSGVGDTTTLRWAVRSNGTSGFLVVNNHQRNPDMANASSVLASAAGVRFNVTWASGGWTAVPCADGCDPVDVPSGAYWVWPLAAPLGATGATLEYATAQPLAALPEWEGPGSLLVALGAPLGGAPVEVALVAAPGVSVTAVPPGATVAQGRGGGRLTVVSGIAPSAPGGVAVRVATPSGVALTLLVLSHDDSLRLHKGVVGGQARLILTAGPPGGGDAPPTDDDAEDTVLLDPATPSTLRLRTAQVGGAPVSVALLPAPAGGLARAGGGAPLPASPLGLFTSYGVGPAPAPAVAAGWALVTPPGGPRNVTIGRTGVALAPNPDGSDGEFAAAAGVYALTLTVVGGGPPPDPAQLDVRLRLNYTGDVARVTLGGALVEDHFYNGWPMELGLARYAAAGVYDPAAALQLHVLPLGRDYPIYVTWPDMGAAASVAALNAVEVVQVWDVALDVLP